jgi:hypothetical protein
MKSSEMYDKTPGDRVRPGKGLEPRVYVETVNDVPYGFEAKVDQQGDVYYLSVSQRPAAFTGPRETVETSPDGLILYLEEQDHYVISDGITNIGTPVETLEQAREQLAEAGRDRPRGGVMQSVAPDSNSDFEQIAARRAPEYVEDPDSLLMGRELLPGGSEPLDRSPIEYSNPVYYRGGLSIMNRATRPRTRASAEDIHESRSEKAQTADESFNAPIAPTIRDWVRAPNRFDLPGVDVISDEVAARRAEGFADRLQERGDISEITVMESLEEYSVTTSANTMGLFNPRKKEIAMREVAMDRRDEGFAGFTLAHETGHAADAAKGLRSVFGAGPLIPSNPSEFAESDEAREQLESLSARARGAFREEQIDDPVSDFKMYRGPRTGRLSPRSCILIRPRVRYSGEKRTRR